MILEHFSNTINADRNKITQNSIFANGWLGIDLDDDGVTVNDVGDPDQGANQQLNMPVINSAIWLAGITTVTGTVDIGPTPNTAVVEVFKAGSDPTGYGEGAVYLGSATPLAGGTWSCSVAGLIPGDDVTATVTDATGNTSEFAQIDYDGTRDYSPEVLVGLSAPPPLPVFDPVWPNPASDHMFLRFTLPVDAEIRISLSDICGREIIPVASPVLRSAGASTLRIDIESLPAGCYQLVCQAGTMREVQWVRIVK